VIFITVGTNPLGYDYLIETVDKIQTLLSEKIVMQIGNGKYKPVHGDFFRFAPSLQPFYEKSDLVITAGGVGTLFELLSLSKKAIGVSNLDVPDHHQDEILDKLSREEYIFWCKDLKDLAKFIEKARSTKLISYKAESCHIHNTIMRYLNGHIKKKQFRYTKF
jgi:UDP-N-acetylglucosamine transferase subunit ALG13